MMLKLQGRHQCPTVHHGCNRRSTITPPSYVHALTKLPHLPLSPPARGSVSLAASTTDGAPVSSIPSSTSIPDIKEQLIRTLCSADRGLAADKQLASRVSELAIALEAAGGPVSLTWGGPSQAQGGTASSTSETTAQSTAAQSPQTSGLATLNGTWRLVYSSGFVDGSLGGSRPGPPSVVAPFILGQVYQVIATYTNRLDNVVDLQFKAGVPTNLIPGVSGAPPLVTATLKHSFTVEGNATVRIVFDGTEVKTRGGINDVLSQIPSFAVPQLPDFLQPPKDVRSATFDVTYLDGDLRITRGDRGELRVYLRP